MNSVGQSDSKKLESKVSVPSTSSTSSANGKNNMSSIVKSNNKFASTSSSPVKDTETYTDTDFQPPATDSSESDEESVSEVMQLKNISLFSSSIESYRKKFMEKSDRKKNFFSFIYIGGIIFSVINSRVNAINDRFCDFSIKSIAWLRTLNAHLILNWNLRKKNIFFSSEKITRKKYVLALKIFTKYSEIHFIFSFLAL